MNFKIYIFSIPFLFVSIAAADGMLGNSVGSSAIDSVSNQGTKKVNTGAISDFELARYQYCGQDSDCVVSVNGCCDCANGSAEVAINKSRLKDFRKRFDCLKYSCGDKDPDPRCGNGVVSCISHKCEYYDDVKRE